MDSGLSVTLLLLFILLSAVFSGSETALTRSRQARLHVLRERGNRGAKSAEDLLANPDRMLAAILLGNNFVNFAASSLAAVVLVGLFGEAGIVYSTVVMTVVIVIFSELLPKTIAVAHAESLACVVAPWLQRFARLFSPFIAVMLISARMARRMMGISEERKDGLNRQELTALIRMSANDGYIDPSHQQMLAGNLRLAQTPVKALMTPRNNICMLDGETPIAQLRPFVLRQPYSRYPVYEERRDNIIGIVHLRHLFSAEDAEQALRQLPLIAPYYIPNNQNAMAQLYAFQQRKEHLAIVVDEYGDIEGLITLEDILESIVGEIQDESDESRKVEIEQCDDHWRVLPTASLHDINRTLETSLPEDRATTIGGMIVSMLGKQPDGDMMLHIHQLFIHVHWTPEKGIHSITIHKSKPSVEADEHIEETS